MKRGVICNDVGNNVLARKNDRRSPIRPTWTSIPASGKSRTKILFDTFPTLSSKLVKTFGKREILSERISGKIRREVQKDN